LVDADEEGTGVAFVLDASAGLAPNRLAPGAGAAVVDAPLVAGVELLVPLSKPPRPADVDAALVVGLKVFRPPKIPVDGAGADDVVGVAELVAPNKDGAAVAEVDLTAPKRDVADVEGFEAFDELGAAPNFSAACEGAAVVLVVAGLLAPSAPKIPGPPVELAAGFVPPKTPAPDPLLSLLFPNRPPDC
jgi:hypothetical protein